ncbi:hypothetical protein V6N13_014544 [Hibiscus sabdariffa]
MEEVIFTDDSEAAAEEEEGITEAYLFTKLERFRLPKLGTFFHGDNSETDAPSLFNEKVAFPRLNDLRIVGIGKCRKIWQHKVAMDSFYDLTYLLVKDCERLSNILPLNMVERLEKLETLTIEECKSVEEIIGLDLNESHTVTSADSIELKSTIKFVFPKIRELNLRMLPKLKGFYSKVHTTEWPSLEQMEVSDCSKVETFAREYINFGETKAESQPLLSVQQPLFWVTEETFPVLEELCLFQNDNMEEIWHGALPNQYFCKLRLLKLFGFPETSVTAPYCFIQSLPNHEVFHVERAALKELFPCEGQRDEEKHAGTLAHLKELTLIDLPNLTHLWKKEVSFAEVLIQLGNSTSDGLQKIKESSANFRVTQTFDKSRGIKMPWIQKFSDIHNRQKHGATQNNECY